MLNIDPHTEELKEYIFNTENRIKEYGLQLRDISMIKKEDIDKKELEEFIDCIRTFIREMLNFEKVRLKELVKEQTYLKQGLNSPHFYELRKIEKPTDKELEIAFHEIMERTIDHKDVFYMAIKFIKEY